MFLSTLFLVFIKYFFKRSLRLIMIMMKMMILIIMIASAAFYNL